MVETLIAAVIIVGIGVLGMCFNIIFRKGGKFPETEVSQNKEMRKLGIRCMREEDEAIFSGGKRKRSADCSGTLTDACSSCGFYEYEFGARKPDGKSDKKS